MYLRAMMFRNRNRALPLALTVAFCAMLFVVSAQKRQTMPSAILVKEKCNRCHAFDTLCRFKYGDIVLTEDSITFKDKDCLYHCYDSGISFLNRAYLIFSFPDGNRFKMEFFNYVSSYVPQYSPIIFRVDWGNTLPLQPTFSKKDWTKSLKRFVKKWNSYADQKEVVLNIIQCGPNYSRTLIVQGTDTIVVGEGYYDTDLQLDLPEPDDSDYMLGVDIIDGDTIFLFPEFFPKFPGGADSLSAYLKREKRWPDNPFLDVVGTVLVEFVVEKDGSVTQPRVKVSLFPDFHDKEALRVVQSMPKWEPATVNGVPVRCYYQIPVTWSW